MQYAEDCFRSLRLFKACCEKSLVFSYSVFLGMDGVLHSRFCFCFRSASFIFHQGNVFRALISFGTVCEVEDDRDLQGRDLQRVIFGSVYISAWVEASDGMTVF